MQGELVVGPHCAQGGVIPMLNNRSTLCEAAAESRSSSSVQLKTPSAGFRIGQSTPESHSRSPETRGLGHGDELWSMCMLNSIAGIVWLARFKSTVSVIDCFAVILTGEESVTWTLKLNDPVSCVLPENCPVEPRVMPVGGAPQETLQVYGGVPPVALKVAV